MLRLEFTAKSFNNNSKKPFFCFIFGAPGVGKGTYAKMLENDLKLKQISTGN